MRREFERKGHRFVSDCDSEFIAVYLAYQIDRKWRDTGRSMKQSIGEIDGVFTYLVATRTPAWHGQGHDGSQADGAFESENLVALASEEVCDPQHLSPRNRHDGSV